VAGTGYTWRSYIDQFDLQVAVMRHKRDGVKSCQNWILTVIISTLFEEQVVEKVMPALSL